MMKDKKMEDRLIQACHRSGILADVGDHDTEQYPTVNIGHLADFYSAMKKSEPPQVEREDGGAAFPVHLPPEIFNKLVLEHANPAIYGMSLRDWFATHAPEMPSRIRDQVIEASAVEDDWREALEAAEIKWRWQYADAMLKARKGGAE